jgi:hypothetical protein
VFTFKSLNIFASLSLSLFLSFCHLFCFANSLLPNGEGGAEENVVKSFLYWLLAEARGEKWPYYLLLLTW